MLPPDRYFWLPATCPRTAFQKPPDSAVHSIRHCPEATVAACSDARPNVTTSFPTPRQAPQGPNARGFLQIAGSKRRGPDADCWIFHGAHPRTSGSLPRKKGHLHFQRHQPTGVCLASSCLSLTCSVLPSNSNHRCFPTCADITSHQSPSLESHPDTLYTHAVHPTSPRRLSSNRSTNPSLPPVKPHTHTHIHTISILAPHPYLWVPRLAVTNRRPL